MNEIYIKIEGNPWSKIRPRISKGLRRTHQPPEDKKAEQRTRKQIELQWLREPLTKNVALRVTFYRASRQVVDLDNLLKHLLDAANGVLWVNDAQVTWIQCALNLDRDHPRTELRVHEVVPYQPILRREYALPEAEASSPT